MFPNLMKDIIAVIDVTFAIAKQKPEKKNQAHWRVAHCVRTRTLDELSLHAVDLCDTRRCTGLPIKLTRHLTWSFTWFIIIKTLERMTTFFRLYFRNCKSCVSNWDDIRPFNSSLRSSYL